MVIMIDLIHFILEASFYNSCNIDIWHFRPYIARVMRALVGVAEIA